MGGGGVGEERPLPIFLRSGWFVWGGWWQSGGVYGGGGGFGRDRVVYGVGRGGGEGEGGSRGPFFFVCVLRGREEKNSAAVENLVEGSVEVKPGVTVDQTINLTNLCFFPNITKKKRSVKFRRHHQTESFSAWAFSAWGEVTESFSKTEQMFLFGGGRKRGEIRQASAPPPYCR